PPPVERSPASDAASPAEVQMRSQAEVNRAARAIRGNGEIDTLKFARVLRPGLPVLVRGAGRQNSGLYYVNEVRHVISGGGYSRPCQCWRSAVGLTGAEVFIEPMAAVA